MMLSALKVAFVYGNGGTITLFVSIDDLINIDILQNEYSIEKITNRTILCVEKFSLQSHQRPTENSPRNKVHFCSNRKFMLNQEALGYVLKKSPNNIKPGDSLSLTITGDVRAATNLAIREILSDEPSIIQKFPKDMDLII